MFNNIAIIAGSGKLPYKIASYLEKLNLNFIILSIKGYSKVNLYKNFKTYSLRMGQGYKAIKLLKKNKIKNIIFLGGLERPSLATLRPDLWTLFKVFKFIFFKKTDDIILRNVVSIFENEGFEVIGLSDITNDFFLKKGIYGWVRNASDGSVEAFIQGEDETLNDLLALCWEGPDLADVEDVLAQDSNLDESIDSFDIL